VRLGAALLFGVALLLPAHGAPRILHFDGLGPVRLGMTARAAERALGGHLKIERPQDSDSIACVYAWLKRDPGVLYMLEDGRITRIDIITPEAPAAVLDVTTETGLRIGASERAVRRAYGARLDVQPHYFDEAPAHILSVEDKGRKRGLLFETDTTRHVVRFRIGQHPALGYVEGCD
jgi:hypothetical protein